MVHSEQLIYVTSALRLILNLMSRAISDRDLSIPVLLLGTWHNVVSLSLKVHLGHVTVMTYEL